MQLMGDEQKRRRNISGYCTIKKKSEGVVLDHRITEREINLRLGNGMI